MIAISIYGLEFYMYGNREVAKGTKQIDKINYHISFFLTLLPITLLIQLGALYFLIPNEVLTIQIFLIIIFVNFCDYFNQEVYRYLIMIKKISKANLLLVAKSSVFLILIVLFFSVNKSINLNVTLVVMFFSFFLLLLITKQFFLKYIISYKQIKIKFLCFKELKKTLGFLFPFILLMLFTKGLEFFDKYAIEYFYNTERVGVYSFLFSIASLIYVFVVSGFYLVYLPELISLNENKSKQILKQFRTFTLLVVTSSIVLSFGIVICIDFLLDIIGKPELKDSISILYILLLAFFFLNLSLIPGLILYIKGKDRTLMVINGFAFLINVVFNLILLKKLDIAGAAIALTITYFINFLITTYFARNLWTTMKKSYL